MNVFFITWSCDSNHGGGGGFSKVVAQPAVGPTSQHGGGDAGDTAGDPT